ncbi:MAG TPA: TRAP transporter large permease [Sandaracinaceae bacterium]
MSGAARTSNGKKTIVFTVLLAAVVLLPMGGPGPLLAACILASAMLGVPLFGIIGIATVLCYLLWGGVEDVADLRNLVERIRTLADNETLLAVPLFMMSGAIMSRGQISTRLIDFAKAVVGWMPGGLAVSAVVACMLFAAISGSSPATVVAIGGMMVPSLVKHGYDERFSQGLLTSAGSLGILIPPSIPMVVYPLVYQGANIQVERLFAAGVGPGLVIGGILASFSVYRGIVDRAERQRFDPKELARATVDGFWSIMFPVLILGGISYGVFNAVEAAAVSVIYAVVVEIWIHGALKPKEMPAIVQETGIFLGSLLVIMVAALALSEFLELPFGDNERSIPQQAVEWIRSMDLTPTEFLLIVNLLLVVVGCLMDILSAMFIFVPLLAPIAQSLEIDPIHFAIIFIVNLEIGYLTPPVGLNLFVASTMFNRPLGHIIRAVLPFIGVMLGGLAIITYFPSISVGLANWIMGDEGTEAVVTEPAPLSDGAPADEPPSGLEPAGPDPEPSGEGGVQTLEEMMREAGIE